MRNIRFSLYSLFPEVASLHLESVSLLFPVSRCESWLRVSQICQTTNCWMFALFIGLASREHVKALCSLLYRESNERDANLKLKPKRVVIKRLVYVKRSYMKNTFIKV